MTYKGGRGVCRVTPFDILERSRHKAAHNDERSPNGPRRNGGNKGCKKDTKTEKDSTEHSRHARTGTSFHSSGRFNVTRHRGQTKEGAKNGGTRIGGKGPSRSRKVALLVRNTHGHDQRQKGTLQVQK